MAQRKGVAHFTIYYVQPIGKVDCAFALGRSRRRCTAPSPWARIAGSDIWAIFTTEMGAKIRWASGITNLGLSSSTCTDDAALGL